MSSPLTNNPDAASAGSHYSSVMDTTSPSQGILPPDVTGSAEPACPESNSSKPQLGDAASKPKHTAIPSNGDNPEAISQSGEGNTIRRNPKRSSSAIKNTTLPEVEIPDNLMDAALAPLDPKELQEWAGWAEFESDPVRNINS